MFLTAALNSGYPQLQVDVGLIFRSMSTTHLSHYARHRKVSKGHPKDFTVATPEEFVKRFGGDHVINKVCSTLMKRFNKK